MNLVVIGGTRGLGHAVVVAAHGAGHTLTVIARNAAAFDAPVAGVRTVVGDAGDPDDVERAVAGQDAVVWTVGVKRRLGEVHVFSRGTSHVITAMRSHGVHRLVCVTGLGPAAPDGNPSPRAMGSGVHDDQARQEALVCRSALDWIVVRPAAMTNGAGKGLYRAMTEPPPGRAKRIARADVADFIVGNLAITDYVHRTVFVTG